MTDSTFDGYLRPDGSIGVRNHVVVMSSVSCANGVVEAIGREVPEVRTITHTEGCGRGPSDVTATMRTLIGTATNPNVAAALIVGLGCEVIQAGTLADQARLSGGRIEHLGIQDNGGTPRSVAAGVEIVRSMLAEASLAERQPFGLEHLTLAVECGGSDSMSGLTANPAIGRVTDWLVSKGGTVIMSEVTEFLGAEDAVASRCATPEVRDRMMSLLADQCALVKQHLGPLAHLVIAPGNAEGGLSSIEEKSLGSFSKGGRCPIQQVVGYAEAPTERGLVVMETPGSDVFSMTGKLAAGAQVLLFSTGRGSPAGLPIVPVIKIASTTGLYERMPDDMDFDAGQVIAGRHLDDVAEDLRSLVVEVANGRETCPERNRTRLYAIQTSGPAF